MALLISSTELSLVKIHFKSTHEKWGETPCAFIEAKEGASITKEEVIKFCKENLANFKVPKEVIFRELPKTSTGKIQKVELRKYFL